MMIVFVGVIITAAEKSVFHPSVIVIVILLAIFVVAGIFHPLELYCLPVSTRNIGHNFRKLVYFRHNFNELAYLMQIIVTNFKELLQMHFRCQLYKITVILPLHMALCVKVFVCVNARARICV